MNICQYVYTVISYRTYKMVRINDTDLQMNESAKLYDFSTL